MTLFETALKARTPFVGAHYNDPVNFKAVLKEIAGKPALALPKPTASVGDSYIYWTEDLNSVTTEMYRKLCDSGATCVVLNPKTPSILVFDAGVMPTPVKFLRTYLESFAPPEKMGPIVQSVAGLALKDAQNLIQLTMASTGSISPADIRKMRMLIDGQTPGLEMVPTDYGFYVLPKVMEDWLALNDKYFLDPKVPEKLVPRGIMAVGAPGTGKSTLSQVIAKHWSVPLFRLDIGGSLTRWLGESESKVARNLQLIEMNAPCVVLLDEVEKLFTGTGNEGSVSRILSQILWWLQYRKGRIIVVMTSNDLTHVPKELYRPGRIDRVVEIQKLSLTEAKTFAFGAYKSILDVAPTMYRTKVLRDALDKTGKGTFAHAEVLEFVVDLIKTKNWNQEDTEQNNLTN